MRTLTLSMWLVVICVSFTLGGCSLFQSHPSETAIELNAFNSLSKEDQDRIKASPKDSFVKIVKYKGQDAYAVTFNHTSTDSSGNITVYVGLDKTSIMGQGFEDEQ
ncbi:hypothetical protein [Paenibacillus sp. MMS18-CY102]|uniref:hypothetical protein n=1 Tax=Paenibacillus sp. MMS18-CY102 TaxID=2682849 RepID=UPI0013661DE3|nr:hypothetical protein [Paenibacillus sp. MMS18-CY102]MWC31099.1 hypothetical protein [Paenibacillus sp. MMS18-CY102]